MKLEPEDVMSLSLNVMLLLLTGPFLLLILRLCIIALQTGRLAQGKWSQEGGAVLRSENPRRFWVSLGWMFFVAVALAACSFHFCREIWGKPGVVLDAVR